MPFDNTGAEARALCAPDTSRDTMLRGLAQTLRRPDEVRRLVGRWSYRNPRSCALGVGHALYGLSEFLTGVLNQMPSAVFEKIFVHAGEDAKKFLFWRYDIPQSAVTPERVADLIEEYLSTRE